MGGEVKGMGGGRRRGGRREREENNVKIRGEKENRRIFRGLEAPAAPRGKEEDKGRINVITYICMYII